jgi:hypothetical protein
MVFIPNRAKVGTLCLSYVRASGLVQKIHDNRRKVSTTERRRDAMIPSARARGPVGRVHEHSFRAAQMSGVDGWRRCGPHEGAVRLVDVPEHVKARAKPAGVERGAERFAACAIVTRREIEQIVWRAVGQSEAVR